MRRARRPAAAAGKGGAAGAGAAGAAAAGAAAAGTRARSPRPLPGGKLVPVTARPSDAASLAHWERQLDRPIALPTYPTARHADELATVARVLRADKHAAPRALVDRGCRRAAHATACSRARSPRCCCGPGRPTRRRRDGAPLNTAKERRAASARPARQAATAAAEDEPAAEPPLELERLLPSADAALDALALYSGVPVDGLKDEKCGRARGRDGAAPASAPTKVRKLLLRALARAPWPALLSPMRRRGAL